LGQAHFQLNICDSNSAMVLFGKTSSATMQASNEEEGGSKLSCAAENPANEIKVAGITNVRRFVMCTLLMVTASMVLATIQFVYTLRALNLVQGEAKMLEGSLTEVPPSESVLHNGRRLVDALGSVDLMTERYIEKKTVDTMVAAVKKGQTNFMMKTSENWLVDFKVFGLSDAPESVVMEQQHGGTVELGIAAVCKEGSDHCSILLPKGPSTSAKIVVSEGGIELQADSGRRLAIDPLSAGIALVSLIVSTAVSVSYGEKSTGGCYPADMEVIVPDVIEGMKKVVVASLKAGEQVLTANPTTHALQFETLLLDFHSSEENVASNLSYSRIFHHGGFLDISPNHFVDSVEHGMTPARNLMVGDHIYAVQNGTTSMSLSPSRILRRESVIKHGMFAKLTNSGTLVVNGVLVSSYTDDEVQSFVPDHVLQNLKKMLGGDQGIHRLIHKLVAPMRWVHTYLPRSLAAGPFWSPSRSNMNKTIQRDALPLYVDYLGRSVAWLATW